MLLQWHSLNTLRVGLGIQTTFPAETVLCTEASEGVATKLSEVSQNKAECSFQLRDYRSVIDFERFKLCQ